MGVEGHVGWRGTDPGETVLRRVGPGTGCLSFRFCYGDLTFVKTERGVLLPVIVRTLTSSLPYLGSPDPRTSPHPHPSPNPSVRRLLSRTGAEEGSGGYGDRDYSTKTAVD